MKTFLEVKNLSVKLNAQPILEGVDFDVKKGESVAIIGPNGAGKTILFKTLLGMLPHTGKIIWYEKPRFGYVPQRFEFDKSFPLTVEEFFLLKTGKTFWVGEETVREKIKAALTEVGLPSLLTKRLGELSAGELQRVLIAHALWSDPNILLFDEPTANVDVGAEVTIYELISRIAESRDLTLLMISHDLSVIFRYADRVICVNREMLCHGIPHEVLTPKKLSELYRTKVHFFEHAPHHR